ncbi:DUF1217 domain-containing protein [Aurantimonas endophytica]|uniref:DUF1217 domain-containing protein n=1 Tax=Aurantimonas endophytica TaxID=1522175 RepID=A0A7W6HDM2_9HYPH|nr:DUF1217 domain-containing protein [Aurantimonas endophytica]MBB4003276.1 hypothetical protein [Aurantimonas endophytica]MCO6404137.1 DUF1217 domain-containing protein [Aurantimonas endophytica]
MLSTYLSYQLYTRDMPKTLDRIASDPVIKRDAEYYRANIHSVSTIDEFMADYRLYSYAMKAYGLEEQIPSRALIKKVLESDLSDKTSIANKLSDERYRTFAAAFTFAKAAEPAKATAQTTVQTDLLVDAYSEHRVRAGQALAATTKAYLDGIGAITDVDAFLDNQTLFTVALEAAGIDPAIASRSFIRDVLTGNAADGPAADGDLRYAVLAAMLPFEPDGSAPAGGLQSPSHANTTVFAYLDRKGLGGSPQAAAYQVSYYEAEIVDVRTADDLVGNIRLFGVALSSVGLDAGVETPAFAWTILTSDPADPQSALNRMAEDTPEKLLRKQQYRTLVERFNFDAQGNVPAGESAQTKASTQATVDAYFGNYQNQNASSDRIASSLFKVAIASVTTALQFVSSNAVYNYALTAFDLDPAEESRSTIMRVLRSDPSDPKSFVNTLGDERYLRLAAAFNFDDSGKVAAPRLAQTAANQADTADRYADRLGKDPTAAAVEKAKAETEAYRSALASVVSVKDFVTNKTITDYALKAYGLEAEKLSEKDLVAILTSDLADPKSFVNASGDKRMIEFAAAYAFTPDGRIDRDGRDVQTAKNFLSTQDFFLRQAMEEEAGSDNEAVRLALYFRRMGPELTSFYDILADPALLNVVQIAVGLPAESGQSNIDVQKRTLEKKLDLESFQDPKQLERFISRFIALYDAQSSSSISSPALMILGSSNAML